MSVLLYLLPLGLMFDLAGYVPPQLRLLLIFVLLGLPLCLRPTRQAGWLGLGLLGLVVLRGVVGMPAVAELALWLVAHTVIWSVSAPVPRGLRNGVAAYTVIHLGLFMSPLGLPLLEWLTAGGNHLTQAVAGQIAGHSFRLGPTYQNLGAFLLFLTLSVFSWDRSPIGLLRSASYVVVALLVNALGAVLLLEKADFAANFAWSLKFRDAFDFGVLWQHLKGLAVIVYPAALFLAQLGAYFILHYGRTPGGSSAAAEPGWRSLAEEFAMGKPRAIAAGAAVLTTLVLLPPTSWRNPVARDLVFVEKGVVSFTKPDYQRYGESAGGMFGMLPEYARLFGNKSTVVKDIPATLDPKQVLVLTNLDVDLDGATHQRIWEFVRQGGALWVLGDHTFIKNGRNHLNEILAPCHISFNNDSAQFFPQGWFNSYRFPQGTPFATLRDDAENRPGILVGASLHLRVPAEPLVVGRFGYSDWGLDVPAGDRGYLGDFKYQSTERLGDLVLVAGEQYGKGRVLVYGDTSSFFNNNLARSSDLLRASLAWLGDSKAWSWPASPAGRAVALILVSAMVAGLFWWRALPLAAAVLLGAGAASWVGHGEGGLPAYDPTVANQHLAVIDFSQHPNASKHSAMDNGLHGVAINLLRHGELPVAMNHWDPALVSQARYLILNAPRQPITGGVQRTILRMMERGGTVILACGHLDAAGSRELLERVGCEISDIPLGRFFDRPAFGRPVSFMSAWALAKTPPSATVICASADWPLIVSVPLGKGRLVLIADSEFLQNRNLEGHKNHDPANTAFLKNLFDSSPQ